MLLIIDDDPSFLADAKEILSLGHNVLLAGSAEQGKSLLVKLADQIAMTMVDLNLPGQDGFSLILELRTIYPHMPILAVSGVQHWSVLESTIALGATAALRKPISREWVDTIRNIRNSRA